MSRLAATVACDLRLQWRNGFYYASMFIVVSMIVLIQSLPGRFVSFVLPVAIFQNVMANSFYFVAGLMLLENGEGTRAAQVVTPLRRDEYLGSKVLTLAALSTLESLLIVATSRGLGLDLFPITLGILLGSVVLTLFGAGLVAPYRSLNSFIMPSVLYTFILGLPLLGYFGIGAGVMYEWHPLQGPLLLMTEPAEPYPVWRLVLAIIVPLTWAVPLWLWSRRAIRQSVRA